MSLAYSLVNKLLITRERERAIVNARVNGYVLKIGKRDGVKSDKPVRRREGRGRGEMERRERDSDQEEQGNGEMNIITYYRHTHDEITLVHQRSSHDTTTDTHLLTPIQSSDRVLFACASDHLIPKQNDLDIRRVNK